MTLGRYGQPTGEHPGGRKRAVDERALLHAYRNTRGLDADGRYAPRVTRLSARCVCGVDIVSKSAHAEDIMRAVSDHNETEPHQLWRSTYALSPDPTTATHPVDVSGNTSGTSDRAGEAA